MSNRLVLRTQFDSLERTGSTIFYGNKLIQSDPSVFIYNYRNWVG